MSEIDEIDAGFDAFAPNQKGHGLYVKFYIDAVLDAPQTKAAGRDVYRDAEMVEIRVPGDMDVIIREATEQDKLRFEREYRGFKRGISEEKLNGTPLKAWPMIGKAMVENLAFFGVKTVEHLADLADNHAQAIGPIQSWKQKAKDWLSAQKDAAVLNKLRSENDDLRLRLGVLEKMVEDQKGLIEQARKGGGTLPSSGPDPAVTALQEQVAALIASMKPADPPPNGVQKRRGRPPGSKNKPKIEQE